MLPQIDLLHGVHYPFYAMVEAQLSGNQVVSPVNNSLSFLFMFQIIQNGFG